MDLRKIKLTKELLSLARLAHQSYSNYLEIEKNKKEEKIKYETDKAKTEEMELQKNIEAAEQETLEKQKNSKKNESDMRKNLSDKLIVETNEKLKKL